MRQKRITKAGAEYHVTVQTNTGDECFFQEDARKLYRDVIADALKLKKYSFKVKSLEFCKNWIDLYLQPGEGSSLSRIMQWIQSRFAQRWNKAHKTFGSVWRDRFFSEVVERAEEAAEWMEEVFEKVKDGLFHKRVKIWSINDQIEGRSKSFVQHHLDCPPNCPPSPAFSP